MNAAHTESTFPRDLTIIVGAVCLGAWLSASQLIGRSVPFSFWLSIALLTIASFFIHRFLINANKKRPQIFVASFMGSLGVKLFLSFTLLILIGLLDNSNLTFSAIGYLIAYMLILVAEIRNLLPLVRDS
jgi:uncharacterized BrkB/YihY/UPF0761 family membrane protein